jgi:hypothetical protein
MVAVLMNFKGLAEYNLHENGIINVGGGAI